jgi:protein Tex
MTHDQRIAQRLSLRPRQVSAAVKLIDEGNTLPFIARYRKELTDNLDDDQLRRLSDLLAHLRALDERRATILHTIAEQGALTPELKAQINSAETLTELEDLYQPYKPRRRTRASIARERGLQPLAELILAQTRTGQTPEQIAAGYLNDDVPTPADALNGACDIVAETISDSADVRGTVREKALKFGLIQCQKIDDAEDEKAVYALYYAFESRPARLKPYQILAINRGEAENVLRVKLDVAERDWLLPMEAAFRPDRRSPFVSWLEVAMRDAASRLLLPAIERDIRRLLTEQAGEHAIQVFATNLRGLLNQPPITGRVVLGIDPAYRTGSKIAVVDPTGKVLDTTTIYPHEPQRRRRESLNMLSALIEKYGVTLIAIGNGTASRETEGLVAELTRELDTAHYLMVNEAGASVYSASPLARAELPDLDVSIRGAVSIARRALDPLAELVKIDPKSIGVGLYQHDVDQKRLSEALDGVVETMVNRVGVDLNTASVALLTRVSGIGAKLAERIVAYRDENGPFPDRKTLRQVPGLGPKAFEQAAGFLRVRDGANPLDASAIHPESYAIAEAVLKRVDVTLTAPLDEREAALNVLRRDHTLEALAAELGAGVPTLRDIIEQLIRPGRDPRADLPAPLLRSDVLSMDDLHNGMHLSGTVRNVVDFGAFVDIGVKQDGLLHISKIPPGITLSVGQVIDVQILGVEKERGRISLGWS